MNVEIISALDPQKARLTPILFVHGSWHAAWCWGKYFLPHFAEHGFAAYALSFRGHGNSDTPERFNSTPLSAYVEDLHGVARKIASHHGQQPPVLVGHSLGGAVVQKYLETHPEIPAAVLMASIPPRGVVMATLRAFWNDPCLFTRVSLRRNLYLLVGTPERAQENLFSAKMSKKDVAAYQGQLGAESYRSYFDTINPFYLRPRRVKTPVLVLGARDDAIFTPGEVAATARAYHTKEIIFDGMAHDMMLEAGWREVADQIISWLWLISST